LALQKGLLTPEGLREAMAAQAHGVARGRKLPRRLGIILIEKKLLTDAQVVALLEEISAVALEESAQRREDKLLGRILVARSLARPEQVEQCLKTQSDSIENCEEHIPRLGELLIIEGHASEEAVRVAL